ncbi:MAG: hypothetical protein JWN25_999 [Verrucomicrobiales bacterium]|nr:hypothetical protein [Verrucomicrobiales bacterium]
MRCIKKWDGLEAGKAYLFGEHPGLYGTELRAIYHIGYEHVATDRQRETDVLTNPWVKEIIAQKRIQLIAHRDLKQ